MFVSLGRLVLCSWFGWFVVQVLVRLVRWFGNCRFSSSFGLVRVLVRLVRWLRIRFKCGPVVVASVLVSWSGCLDLVLCGNCNSFFKIQFEVASCNPRKLVIIICLVFNKNVAFQKK